MDPRVGHVHLHHISILSRFACSWALARPRAYCRHSHRSTYCCTCSIWSASSRSPLLVILQRRSERPLWHTVSYDSPSNVLYSKARIYIIQYTLRHTGPTARQNAGAVGGGGGARGAPDSCRRSSLRSGAMPRSLLSPRDDARLRCHQSCMLICSHVRK